MSLNLVRKALFLTIATAMGAIFGPTFLQKKPVDPIVIQQRLDKNIDIIRQFMDQKYGEGYFDRMMAKEE